MLVKPRPLGSAPEVITRAFGAAGGEKRVAHLIGLELSQTYAYGAGRSGDKDLELSLDRCRRLADADAKAAAVFAEDFAAFAGAALLPLAGDEDETLGQLLAQTEKAHGEAIGALLARLGRHLQGRLSTIEQRELRRDLLAMMRPLAAALLKLPEDER